MRCEVVRYFRRDAPVTLRCTRTEGVYCLRIGCSALINKESRGRLLDDNAGLATKCRCEGMKRP